jgi:SPP1 family predicted phage head-tail adaptor
MTPGQKKRKGSGILAGDLGLKVSLQRKSSGKDELGQPIEVWTEYASVWGKVLTLNGIEKVAGGTQIDKGNASIRIRWRLGINNGDRAIAQNVIYNIASVLPNVATREFVDLACTENANAG